MVSCPICGEELEENNPGTGSFIVRELFCLNEKCPLYRKRLDIFFDGRRIDVEGKGNDFIKGDLKEAERSLLERI